MRTIKMILYHLNELRSEILQIPKVSFLVGCLSGGYALSSGFTFSSIAAVGDADAAEKRNVLFIAVDDLRPTLGCYGDSKAITPNIDRLAASGFVFKKHYVQVPTCGASRVSILTGRYPRTRAACGNGATAIIPRGSADSARTIPELFRRNGYKTICIGKISHSPDGTRRNVNGDGSMESHLPDAWDEWDTPCGQWGYGYAALFAYANGRHREDGSGYKPYSEFPDVEDNELPDGMMADAAIVKLREAKMSNEPFFIGLGFYKPHLPFVAPKRYHDLYEGVSLPSLDGLRKGDSRWAHGSSEFYKYDTNRSFEQPSRGESIAESDAQEIRRAYYACVSYVDAQIGRVLDTLREEGLENDTIVVLWGDHGWHLGENNVWGKHTPLEKSLQSPLIIRVPRMAGMGRGSESIVSSVDVYPTLIELCQLPDRKTNEPLDGQSMLPIFLKPETRIRDAAVSFWGGATSVYDGQHRLIIWDTGDTGGVSSELYDHDTDSGELKNIAIDEPQKTLQMRELLRNIFPQELIPE